MLSCIFVCPFHVAPWTVLPSANAHVTHIKTRDCNLLIKDHSSEIKYLEVRCKTDDNLKTFVYDGELRQTDTENCSV